MISASAEAFTSNLDDFEIVRRLNARHRDSDDESMDSRDTYTKENSKGWTDPEEGGWLHR
jgi:hypothetical protein